MLRRSITEPACGDHTPPLSIIRGFTLSRRWSMLTDNIVTYIVDLSVAERFVGRQRPAYNVRCARPRSRGHKEPIARYLRRRSIMKFIHAMLAAAAMAVATSSALAASDLPPGDGGRGNGGILPTTPQVIPPTPAPWPK